MTDVITLLVVDDDDMNREIMEAYLSSEGYSVLLTGNGASALNIVRAQRPQLVILDVRMPDMDGYSVCRTLKADPNTQHIPILLVSGYDDMTHQQLGQAAGADSFLARPFNGDDLVARIAGLLNG